GPARRYPHIARPFRTPFYPLPQLFGIAGMIYAVVHVSPTPEMTGRIFASAGVVLGVVSLVAVVWIKGVMRKPLFVPEPLETAGETAQGKSVALDPLQSPSA
ncbi:amino acid transporter, partial [Pseudomonas aeruginosa]